ncbi:MAG: hypothetical protein Q9198_002727 [Flavoplaca austrocitrina]
MSIRHTRPLDQDLGIEDQNEPEENLEALFEGDTHACMILTMDSPHEALSDMVSLYGDVEYLTSAFVLTLCRQPGLRFSDTEKGEEIVSPSCEKPPSPIEFYRIRRALWRFWLLCDIAYHDPEPIRPRLNAINAYAVQCLVQNMTLWESEELECVYFFLQQWYSAIHSKLEDVRNPTPSTTVQEQPPVIKRLLIAMGYHLDARCPPVLDEDSTDLPGGRSLHFYAFIHGRAKLDRPQAPLTTWSDAPCGANIPSEGWQCYSRYSSYSPKALGPLSTCPYRPSMGEFHKWAYCIWDRDRLEEWDMLDRPRGRKGNRKVDVARWYYGADEEELTKDERDSD